MYERKSRRKREVGKCEKGVHASEEMGFYINKCEYGSPQSNPERSAYLHTI